MCLSQETAETEQKHKFCDSSVQDDLQNSDTGVTAVKFLA